MLRDKDSACQAILWQCRGLLAILAALAALATMGAELAAQEPASRPAADMDSPEWLPAEEFDRRVELAQSATESYEAHLAVKLDEGLSRHWIRRPSPGVILHVFELRLDDARAPRLELVKAMPDLLGRERLEQMAQRLQKALRPFAGANGGFWDERMRPVGVLAGEGKVYTAGSHRWTFLLGATSCHLGEVDIRREVRIGSSRLEISGFNAVLPGGGCYLYTSEFGKRTPQFQSPVTALRVKLGRPLQINRSTAAAAVGMQSGNGPFEIAESEAVLVCPSREKASPLLNAAAGVPVEIVLETDQMDGPVELAVSAGPMLLENGGFSDSVFGDEVRALAGGSLKPRTAIGLSEDRHRLLLAVMEGIRPGLNTGGTLQTMAQEMQRLGAWNAMNLDGGSSSGAWAQGRLVTRPTPLVGARPISNALFFIGKSPSSGGGQ